MNIESSNPEFSVKIVVCDHYLSKPIPGLDVIYSDFRGSDIKQVPILRVFGAATDGHKACLHIHGVFPYFYIPCPSPNPEPQLLYQIAGSLDKALNIALKQATSSNQHVYKITLVKGLPFYGFHNKDHLYLKVFLYSPNLIKQAVELCSNGAILGQTFQPHESHLNFTLQFFIDFNLFGMSNIDLQKVHYRKTRYTQNSNQPISNSDQTHLKSESMCFYEADCSASHIINRQRIGRGDGIENPGLEEVWKQEIERRKHLNMSMASKSLSQGRIGAVETESHYKSEQIFLMKLKGAIDEPVATEAVVQKEKENMCYPAEMIDGTQWLDAVDVSIHLPEQNFTNTVSLSEIHLDGTLVEDVNETVVDENLALSISLPLQYSQILLNSEDLDLVDMLQDMDEKAIEQDSVMGTPADFDEDINSEADDAEYSQIYNDETIIDNFYKNKDCEDESLPSWNDSFWEGANIPQLDGTFDDDHVKKVRKRKLRPYRLGLSKPKEKKNFTNKCVNNDTGTNLDISDIDEINVSRDTIDSVCSLHLQKCVKVEPVSIVDNSFSCDIEESSENIKVENESILDLVNKITIKNEHNPSKEYDILNKYVPEPGTSATDNIIATNSYERESLLDNVSNESSPDEDKLGIISFYDTSKIFDISINNSLDTSIVPKSDHKNLKEIKSKVNRGIHEFSCDSVILIPKNRPPTKVDVVSSLHNYNIPSIRNPEPFYSDPNDVGDKIELGSMLLKLHSKSARDQKPFDKILDTTTIEEWRQLLFLQTNEMSDEYSKPDTLKNVLAGNRHCILQPILNPPTTNQVEIYLDNTNIKNTKLDKTNEKNDICVAVDELENSQALGLNDDINDKVTPEYSEITMDPKADDNNSLQITMQPDGSFLCFGSGDYKKENITETPIVEVDFLTLMLTEVHTQIRGDLYPDPAIDSIQAIFVMITNDCPPESFLTKTIIEALVIDDGRPTKYLDRCVFDLRVSYFQNENELLENIVELVKKHDPDIMCGYEMEINSWGYILERAQLLGMEIVKEVSRITDKNRQKRWRSEENEFEGRIIGRITFNVWRLFRHELALSSYSFENCMYEILKERVPNYSYSQLQEWWNHESRVLRWIPVEYYLTKLKGTVRMLEKLDIINRTSELARLFGLQWWEVLSRGSQFRVESLMLRAARPLNLIALSPTVRQRAAMRAPECLPLIFEPESRFYSDPVIVLDFQSLYPSMMIAYNYCFSTCIGRVQSINGDTAYEFGAWKLKISKSKLEALVNKGLIHWSPVGVGFVKQSVRRGVLPALLRRILAARQAVKKSMKQQIDEAVKRSMHSRQLGLKLIANVTYGYTAANFSGRMPCVEVGDSVVAKGRETLERAIKLVRDNKNWNAKVVYGDTDSMFVLVPGGTRAEAFDIGQQIADAVTADNPSPVALKLEKVYQPCILQTKKRYVGYMYESADQEKPVYEAKGIETVRRDGCPAGVKLLQQCLCELFDSGDMSRVKRIVQSTLSKLASGSLPPQDLMFTREYHGPTGYRPGAVAPPNEIAKRIASRDRRAVPRTGERVAWLIAAGAPGTALVRLARSRQEVAATSPPPHYSYYAARVLLPPLHRCLSLLGADVFKWWCELGYRRGAGGAGGGIARYMWRVRCARCGAAAARALCARCAASAPAAAALALRLAQAHRALANCDIICRSCSGHNEVLKCDNMECPVFWRRLQAKQKLSEERDIVTHLPAQLAQESMDF